MFAASHYDVYVTAPGTDITRQATLPRLVRLYKIGAARLAALDRGERVLLLKNVEEKVARRVVTDLRSLGCKVDIEARIAELEAVGIDGGADEPAPAKPSASMIDPLFNVNAGLVGLDGEDEAPSPSAATSSTGVDSLLGLFGAKPGAALLDGDEPPPPAPRRAPPPPRPAPPVVAQPAPPPVVAAPASPFRPAGLDDESQQLTLDRAPPSFSEAEREAAAASDTVEAPRCTTHGAVRVRGRCPECDAEEAYVKSRLLGGRLRNRPQLRWAIGIGAGLALGYVVTAPMSRHGDMRVQDLRDQAQRERERPTEEGQAKAAQLASDADDAENAERTKLLGTWALITAVVTGIWFKLT